MRKTPKYKDKNHFTTLSLKFVVQSLITLHMNHTFESRRNNTNQFHNKQLASVMQQLCAEMNLEPHIKLSQ